MYCVSSYCIALYFIVLYCIVSYCTVLYCIVLYCAVLYVLCCVGGEPCLSIHKLTAPRVSFQSAAESELKKNCSLEAGCSAPFGRGARFARSAPLLTIPKEPKRSYCTVLYCSVVWCIVVYYPYCTGLYCVQCIAIRWPPLAYSMWCCIVLYCIMLRPRL